MFALDQEHVDSVMDVQVVSVSADRLSISEGVDDKTERIIKLSPMPAIFEMASSPFSCRQLPPWCPYRRRLSARPPPACRSRPQIHVHNHRAEVVVAAAAWRQRSHPSTHLPQRPLRWPPLQVVDALPRPYPDGPAHALAQMTPEEVKALATPREVDLPRFVRMQLQAEACENLAHALLGLLARRFRGHV